MANSRNAAAVWAACALSLLAGCSVTHTNGTIFCGTRVPTGAAAIIFESLKTSAAPPTSTGPPAVSTLPPVDSPQPENLAGAVSYIRTSDSCDRGAVVEVLPSNATRLAMIVPAKDGKIAGIVLRQVTAPVVVAAWVADHYEGSLTVTPPGSGPS